MQFDRNGNRERVERLQRRGVDAWGPERVYVCEDVDLDRIETGAVIRQATLSGASLSIAGGARIGVSGHAEVRDCQIGRDAELGAGLYEGATLLEGVRVRGSAEIRPGTLLEEQAEAAHCVAMKNTTFTACCVAGSVINFCDLFLSGGRSRRDHTEIGSGAVHFNFDPRGDKWGSLIGGIRGVLLRSDPVFVGGNCGLVGPVEVGFGAVIAAGSVIRKDAPSNALVAASAASVTRPKFDRRIYGSLKPRVLATAKLIGTLRALDAWYAKVRLPSARGSERRLYESARRQIATQAEERIHRISKIVAKLPESIRRVSKPGGSAARPRIAEHRLLVERWEALRKALEAPVDPGSPPEAFADAYAKGRGSGRSHLGALQSVAVEVEETAEWLEAIVADIVCHAEDALE